MTLIKNKSTKPTTILTGFLGAGKTTYLNHIIDQGQNVRYAIIENEYGEQSIDCDLIMRAEGDVVELNNGCLCCTLNENLYEILNSLYHKRDEYDQLIIEATGVADPRGLAEPFIGNPSIKKQFPLAKIICLVDAERLEEQLRITEEAIHQITFSDILLVNKTDLVGEEQLKNLTATLKRLNPLAVIAYGNKDEYPDLKSIKRSGLLENELNGGDNDGGEEYDQFPVQKPSSHHHHDHTDGIASCTLFFDRPFDYPKLHLRLLGYLTFQAKEMYRMKGFVWLDGSEDQHVLQSVGVRLSIDKKRTCLFLPH